MLDESQLGVQLIPAFCSNLSEKAMCVVSKGSASWGAGMDGYRAAVL